MNKRLPIQLAVGIIIIIALIIGGAFYFTNRNNSSSVKNLVVDSGMAKNTDVSINTDTAGWKTYTNKKYGFSLKYPSDFVPINHYGLVFRVLKEEKEGWHLINVGIRENRQVGDGMTFQGRNAHKYYYREGDGYSGVFLVQLNNGTLEIYYEMTKNANEDFVKGELDKIISTLEIADNELPKSSEVDISGRKTYTNEEYGFEFKYPNNWYFDGNGRLSPQKIEYYQMTGLDNAPIHLAIYSKAEDKYIFGSSMYHGSWFEEGNFFKENNISDIIIGGKDFKRYNWHDDTDKLNGNGQSNRFGNFIWITNYPVSDNKEMPDLKFDFEWYQHVGNKEYSLDDFMEIISTFKLIDKVDCIYDKAYTNKVTCDCLGDWKKVLVVHDVPGVSDKYEYYCKLEDK